MKDTTAVLDNNGNWWVLLSTGWTETCVSWPRTELRKVSSIQEIIANYGPLQDIP